MPSFFCCRSTNKLKPIHTLTGHLGVVSAVQFNEVRIVSGATDGKVKCVFVFILFVMLFY